jgi:CDP-diacylglycerol--serine O-phosphatidyltransferase
MFAIPNDKEVILVVFSNNSNRGSGAGTGAGKLIGLAAMEGQDGEHRLGPALVRGGKIVREKLQGKAFVIPSLVTVAAFFSGFLGAIAAIRGDFVYATKAIALAALFDGLDGRVARKLNAATAFGREFDSLCDVVTFGVAPAVLVYCWAFQNAAGDFGVLAAFIYTVSAGARLARFNVEAEESPGKKSFSGLPTPGAAIAVIALVYFFPTPVTESWARGLLSLFMISLGALMVSELPYFSLKNLRFTPGHARRNVLLIALGVGLAWYSSHLFILVGAMAYAYSGAIGYAVRRFFPGYVESLLKRERKIMFG